MMFLYMTLWQQQMYVEGRFLNYTQIGTRGLSLMHLQHYKALWASTHDSIIMC
jgi:hypothetical protein